MRELDWICQQYQAGLMSQESMIGNLFRIQENKLHELLEISSIMKQFTMPFLLELKKTQYKATDSEPTYTKNSGSAYPPGVKK